MQRDVDAFGRDIRDHARERAFLVDVVAFDGSLWCFEPQPNIPTRFSDISQKDDEGLSRTCRNVYCSNMSVQAVARGSQRLMNVPATLAHAPALCGLGTLLMAGEYVRLLLKCALRLDCKLSRHSCGVVGSRLVSWRVRRRSR